MSAKLQQVHVRVNDAVTGKPTPCRVRFADAQRWYAPHGRTAELPWAFEYVRRSIGGYVNDEREWAYIDGGCEIDLPIGALDVMIEKGPEFERIERTIECRAGKLALRFELHRLFDPGREGWHGGAMVCTPLSPHDMLLEGAAEGLRVVDLLAYERETTVNGAESWPLPRPRSPESRPSGSIETLIDFPNLTAFSGQRPCIETPECMVAVNTLNRHTVLGELALLNSHRIVFPLRFGQSSIEGSAYDRLDNWTLADWCDQCHRKGGLVVGMETHWWEEHGFHGGEELADLILGKIDAVGGKALANGLWYTMLSLGFRVPIISDCPLRPLGMFRTYIRIPDGEQFTYAKWIEGIRAGRTTFSAGPFLTITADGHDPGACIRLSEPGAIVKVRAEARSREPFEQLEIVHDEDVLAAQSPQQALVYHAAIETECRVRHGGWLAARCVSRGLGCTHTSPIYLEVEGQPQTINTAEVEKILGLLDRTLSWVNSEARVVTPKDRERLASVFLQAKQVLLRKLEPESRRRLRR